MNEIDLSPERLRTLANELECANEGYACVVQPTMAALRALADREEARATAEVTYWKKRLEAAVDRVPSPLLGELLHEPCDIAHLTYKGQQFLEQWASGETPKPEDDGPGFPKARHE